MNAFLLLTSAALGADPAPVVKPGTAPAATTHGGPIVSSTPWGGSGGSCCGGGGGGCGDDCGCGDSCGCGGGFFGKLRGRFHRNKGCGCEDSCGCGCGGGAYGGAHYGAGGTVIGAPGTMAPVGEPIKAPKDGGTPAKKLPDGGKKPAGSTSAIPEVTPLPPLATQGVGTGTTANPF